MPTILNFHLDGDGVLKGIPAERLIWTDTPLTVASLSAGTEGGLPSIAIIIDLPDGRKAIAQTTARLFIRVADVLRETYGEVFE